MQFRVTHSDVRQNLVSRHQHAMHLAICTCDFFHALVQSSTCVFSQARIHTFLISSLYEVLL